MTQGSDNLRGSEPADPVHLPDVSTTTSERQIWIATFAAAYVAAVQTMRHGQVELCEDIAATAASVASEALAALKDAQRNGSGRLSLAAGRDLEAVLLPEGP